MATYYAFRSFRSTFIALIAIGCLVTSCKNMGGGDNVDPREQYLGVYDGGYQASTLVNNSYESRRESGTIQVTVSKAQNANQVTLDLVFNGSTKQTMTAELSNATFTIVDKSTEALTFDGKTINDAKYTAQGQFVDKTIVINTTTETLQSGLTISRLGNISGTLK
ncbi:hypothetical protein GCM10028805_42730 [Spirosoma harenae]